MGSVIVDGYCTKIRVVCVRVSILLEALSEVTVLLDTTVDRRDLQVHVRETDAEQVEFRRLTRLRKCGRYEVKGPNLVWSIDGHDKLSRFGFEIYGCIDAYSWYIIWCYCGHSNRTAVSVNKQFLEAVEKTGVFPKTIRSDMGWEVILISNSQLKLCRAEKPEPPFQKIYSSGTSTRNQRIEAWWNHLAGSQTETWREFFEELEKDGFFDGGKIDKACLQFLYMSMI